MFESLNFNFAEVHWLVITAIAIYAWFVGRLSASAKDVADLRLRIVMLEEQQRNTVTRDELSQIEADLRELKANQSNQSHQLDLVRRGVTRIEDYLLDNNK